MTPDPSQSCHTTSGQTGSPLPGTCAMVMALVVLGSLLCCPIAQAQPTRDADAPARTPSRQPDPGQRDQTEDTQAPTVDALIEQLDAPELAKRDAAMLDLFEREALTLDALEAMLSDPNRSLSVEQQLRLKQLALGRFMQGPRAALGISFGGEHPQGTPIARTVEGFAAAALLKAGDIVIEADGIPTLEQEALRVAILAHEPGEQLHLVVLRDGKEITIDVPLGSYDSLQSAMRPPEMSLLVAWQIRQARLRAARETDTTETNNPAIPSLLVPQPDPAIAHSQADFWPEPDSVAWERVFGTTDVPASLGQGGMPRRIAADISIHELMTGSMASRLLGQAAFANAAIQAGGNGMLEPMEAGALLTLLRAQRVDVLRQLGNTQRMLAKLADDPANPAAARSRQSLNAQLTMIQQRLDTLDKRIAQLEASQPQDAIRR